MSRSVKPSVAACRTAWRASRYLPSRTSGRRSSSTRRLGLLARPPRSGVGVLAVVSGWSRDRGAYGSRPDSSISASSSGAATPGSARLPCDPPGTARLTGMHAPSDVTFVERYGPDAVAILRRLQARLSRGGTSSRLLRSHDRPDLGLLVVDGVAPLSDDAVRDARVWRFVDAAPEGRDPDSSPDSSPDAARGTRAADGGTAS